MEISELFKIIVDFWIVVFIPIGKYLINKIDSWAKDIKKEFHTLNKNFENLHDRVSEIEIRDRLKKEFGINN